MSTRCNFCQLADFHALAKQRGYIVTLRPYPMPDFPVGQDVFIHPENEPPVGWWAGWLARVPTECHCAD